jgi:hypothetical protein
VALKEIEILGDGFVESVKNGKKDPEALDLAIGDATDPGAATVDAAVPVSHSSGPRRTEPDRKVVPRGLR